MLPEAIAPSGLTPELSRNLDSLTQTLLESSYVVAMTGAGMSVESGIPTFRGADGLWTRYGQPPMDGYSRFRADPAGYWHRQVNRLMDAQIVELRDALRAAKPHVGHFALARLERMGVLKAVITQNIDSLDLKAGLNRLIEIHGNRSRLRCIDCGRREALPEFVLNSAPPPCIECGGVVKYDAVMFGEPVPPDVLEDARRETDRADCVLSIGTSATVRPASGLMWIAHANGARVVEINPAETRLSTICEQSVRATAGIALPELCDRVSKAMTASQPFSTSG